MRSRQPSRHRTSFLVAVILALVLGACGGGSDEADAGATPTASAERSTYLTKAFVVPLAVTVPGWLPAAASTDAPNFVTWETGSFENPAVRFLVPVNVYRPGDTSTSPPPADYLTYLLSQSEFGATFTDSTKRTVGGRPATVVTATTSRDGLSGSLGCQAEGLTAEDCFGLQPDLTLRIAVVDAGDSTLVTWLRHDGSGESEDTVAEFAAFEQILSTLRFRDERPPTAAPKAAPLATPLDGVWTTKFSYDELASSSLLYDPQEVNDGNWGDFTFTFDQGGFTFNQENSRDTYSSSGTFVVDGDTLLLALTNLERFEMRWGIEGDTLTFTRDESLGIAPTPYVLKPWTRKS